MTRTVLNPDSAGVYAILTESGAEWIVDFDALLCKRRRVAPAVGGAYFTDLEGDGGWRRISTFNTYGPGDIIIATLEGRPRMSTRILKVVELEVDDDD